VCCRYQGAPLRADLDGFTVLRVPSSYVLDRRVNVPWPVPSPRRLLGVLRDAIGSADVVHAQDAIYATSVAALALSRRHRVPSVLTQHVAFVPQKNALLDAVERAAIASLGRSARLATCVACLNPAVAAWVASTWGREDVRVLPVGVPVPQPSSRGRDETRRCFGLPVDRFVALFVGRDVPKKGLDVFLASADPAYELVAVTDRPAPVDGALLVPFMSVERVQELLTCVDAFVLPSEGEGFPVSVQEALAAGLPVVTTEQPGYDKYLASDEVVFVDRTPESVRAALRRLVADDGLRRALSARARAAAQRNFGVDAFVAAYEQLYVEAAAF
jgi:D-inositol-3-phosphate glycosyltransferase